MYTKKKGNEFKAVADEFCTLVYKGSRVNPSPSKALTRAWIPVVNDWDTEMASAAIAKAFDFKPALVPERRLEALREEIIKKDPKTTVAFGCCCDLKYDIFRVEDYDTLMSPNGDIMLVFDDMVLIMS